MPSWVAQRLWLGTLIFAAGLGMRYLLRTLGVRGPGVAVGMLAYMFTPYVLEYSSRFSGAPRPVGRAAVDDRVRRARAAPRRLEVPGALRDHGAARRRGQRDRADLRRASVRCSGSRTRCGCCARATLAPRPGRSCWRTGLLTLVTSLWWIVGTLGAGRLRARHPGVHRDGRDGLEDVVRERDPARPRLLVLLLPRPASARGTTASSNYTQVPWLILVSYAVPTLALLSARCSCGGATARSSCCIALARRGHRGRRVAVRRPVAARFAVQVVRHELDGRARAAQHVAGRAARRARARRAARRRRHRRRPTLWPRVAGRGSGSACAVVGRARSCSLNFTGHLGRVALQPVPRARRGGARRTGSTALRDVDARPHDTRVLALPGSDFAAYRWGVTIDPIEPGLIDRPYVARELVPWGSPPSATC